MPLAIFLIALGVGLIFLVVFLVRSFLFTRHLVRNFKKSNVIVDGKKGKGKDLVFQHVINKRKTPYYANIDYGGAYTHIDLKEISVEPNTFVNFIEGNIERCGRRFVEKKDVYISDGGVYLPSYADSTLHKTYRSMPLAYPMTRHIADMNVHVNVQNLERVWKPLREQADFYVHVDRNLKLPFLILVHAVTYDKFQSALRSLLPLKGRFLNAFSKAEADRYLAENGEIKSGWLIIRKSSIRYDTRAFEKVLYGDAPRIFEE